MQEAEYDGRPIRDICVPHEVWVSESFCAEGARTGPRDERIDAVWMRRPHPVVALANCHDDSYTQYFANWEDLAAFIAALEAAGQQAWGEQSSSHREDDAA
jgi:hypothetical protein